jgi:hypothetical protein
MENLYAQTVEDAHPCSRDRTLRIQGAGRQFSPSEAVPVPLNVTAFADSAAGQGSSFQRTQHRGK